MMKKLLLSCTLLIALTELYSQSCIPQGDETSYGSDNTWIGYVYDNEDLTSYKGYITEGSSANPAFDESFGGANTTLSTNGCSIQTETFSLRLKLTKTFTAGAYKFIVGADDGYRLSLDGGATWVIDKWALQSYTNTEFTTTLSGTVNMVLEYYDHYSDNRLSFYIDNSNCGTESPSEYGSENTWRGYIYDGISFDSYKGMVLKATSGDASFNESFGGSNNQFATSGCNVQTESFSARYRLRKTFPGGEYTFVVGGDDGFRFSLDGGATWEINNWNYHSYTTTSKTITLSAGTYDMVLEYFEGGGDNYLSFLIQTSIPLPVKLISFSGAEDNQLARLTWSITPDSDPDYFIVEKSANGSVFTNAGTVFSTEGKNNGGFIQFNFTDPATLRGVTQYRLKMVDKTGLITYSLMVNIKGNAQASSITRIFPTVITNAAVTIKAGEKTEKAILQLTDLSGKTLLRHSLGALGSGQTIQVSLSAASLPAGMYIARVIDQHRIVAVQKLVIP